MSFEALPHNTTCPRSIEDHLDGLLVKLRELVEAPIERVSQPAEYLPQSIRINVHIEKL